MVSFQNYTEYIIYHIFQEMKAGNGKNRRFPQVPRQRFVPIRFFPKITKKDEKRLDFYMFEDIFIWERTCIMKERADEMTDKQLESFLDDLKVHPDKYTKDSKERWAWYTDPANKDEVNEQLSHMQLVKELHKARKEAGLTQEELAKRMGTKQSYIAAIERGRKNVSYSTIARFAHACGKRIAITLL